MSDTNIFASGLDKTPANYVPLSPLSFLKRAARIYPERTAVVNGDRRYTYAEFHDRVCRFRSGLGIRGIGAGDVVAVLAPNTPVLLEAHYAVPAAGAVLSALNTRLDAASIGFILGHSEAKILFVDYELADTARRALESLTHEIEVIFVADDSKDRGPAIGSLEYEDFLAGSDADPAWDLPRDEWSPITLNYTSGTTGDPKGVVYSHRGAYLSALANVISFSMGAGTVYLWTLPMFHCNGWTHSWAVTAAGGTHVCLRRIDPALIFNRIASENVTHMAGAPIVLSMLIHAPAETQKRGEEVTRIAVGGAPPPSIVIERMEAMGFEVVHLYGLTETYGPTIFCDRQDSWASLDKDQLARQMARQGCGLITTEDYIVANAGTIVSVADDAAQVGEILIRSNGVMMGYLKNPSATTEAFEGGWFHSGDLAVMHPDAYVEIKDRSKDVIISGGENISSIEVEEILTRNPAVREVAVVARPDEKWGETPCAFIDLVEGTRLTGREVMDWSRQNMAHFKVPRTVVFGPLPKTSTGKIQKFLLRDRARALSAAGAPGGSVAAGSVGDPDAN